MPRDTIQRRAAQPSKHPRGFCDGVTITTGSEPPVTLKAGASFYQPPGEWHAVSTANEGAKTVVFRVLKKGQPMIVAVD